jgi:hypothetical protein
VGKTLSSIPAVSLFTPSVANSILVSSIAVAFSLGVVLPLFLRLPDHPANDSHFPLEKKALQVSGLSFSAFLLLFSFSLLF